MMLHLIFSHVVVAVVIYLFIYLDPNILAIMSYSFSLVMNLGFVGLMNTAYAIEHEKGACLVPIFF